ncbi:hypothetical protein ANO11243_080670 [Dothideomycetidae sp. 11243]|nr:hypothetical protein ANO11243_080670 [fungal sp. No.11243]
MRSSSSLCPGDRLGDMAFKRKLHESSTSQIFLVGLDGNKYVLKVYHRHVQQRWDVTYREIDSFNCENHAYSKLLSGRVCDDGSVPYFYASSDAIDPKQALPHLGDFVSDTLPPAAILLEYLPDLQMLVPSNFSSARGAQFVDALHRIHALGILHADPAPRHMLIQRTTGRTVWIDFDAAQTFDPRSIPERWPPFFEEEKGRVRELMDALQSSTPNSNFQPRTCLSISSHSCKLRIVAGSYAQGNSWFLSSDRPIDPFRLDQALRAAAAAPVPRDGSVTLKGGPVKNELLDRIDPDIVTYTAFRNWIRDASYWDTEEWHCKDILALLPQDVHEPMPLLHYMKAAFEEAHPATRIIQEKGAPARLDAAITNAAYTTQRKLPSFDLVRVRANRASRQQKHSSAVNSASALSPSPGDIRRHQGPTPSFASESEGSAAAEATATATVR